MLQFTCAGVIEFTSGKSILHFRCQTLTDVNLYADAYNSVKLFFVLRTDVNVMDKRYDSALVKD